MNTMKQLVVCLFLLLGSREFVLAQEKLNGFVINPDSNCPFTIRPGDGGYGFVVINTTLSDLRFAIPAAPSRLVKAEFNSDRQQWILTIVPNDINYKRYKITINSKGFKQGEIEVLVKQKESQCFDVDPLQESNSERNLAEAKSRAASEMANRLNQNGDSYLASIISLAALDVSYTKEAEMALRKANYTDNMILYENQEIRGMSLSSDGKLLSATSGENTIHVWDAVSGRMLFDLSYAPREDGWFPDAVAIVYNSSDNTIISAFSDNIGIWDAKDGRCKQILNNNGCARVLALSPNKKYLAASSCGEKINLWDLGSGKCLRIMEGGIDIEVSSLCFSPNGEYLLASSLNNTICMWNVSTGRFVRSMNGHVSYVNSVSFSPNGRQIATGSNDNTIRLWDALNGNCIKTIPVDDRVTSLLFCQDGKRIIAGVGNDVCIIDVDSSKRIKSFHGHTDIITSIASCCEDSRVFTSSFDGTIRKWNLSLNECQSTIKAYDNLAYSASFSPDGKQIVSSAYDKTVILWDVSNNRQIRQMIGHTDLVTFSSFSKDGKLLVSCGGDKTVRVWDAASGKCLHILKGHNELIRHAEFSPDGKLIASASIDGTIRVWDVKTGICIRVLNGHRDGAQYSSFSSDGKLLVTCGWDEEASIRVWNVSNWECIKTFHGDSDGAGQATFSPDNKYVLTVDRSVCLWDVQSGECVLKINDKKDGIHRAIFNADGTFIISVSSNKGTIKVWDANNGKSLLTIGSHNGSVNSIALSSNGKISIAGDDGNIRIWSFPSLQDLVNQTRERFKDRPLTPEERRYYYLE